MHLHRSSSKTAFKESANSTSKQHKAAKEESSKGQKGSADGAVMMLASQGAADAKAAHAATGLCCYSGPTDCDGARDYCSKNEANCAVCGGLMHLHGSSSKTAVKESANSTKGSADGAVMMLAAAQDAKSVGAGLCCYTGPTDCDGAHDYCSKDEANCAECGGLVHLHGSSSKTAFKESA